MRYIIMCGGKYRKWEKPRHLTKIHGEAVVARTIRLLNEEGVNDIAISSNDPAFEGLGVPVLHHRNWYIANGMRDVRGNWFDAFFPTDYPVCYLFGDVVFSPAAIKTIVETDTDDIELFGSAPPFAEEYPKDHIEPFALKVARPDHLKEAIERTKALDAAGAFWRKPIMWELWTVIKGQPLQTGPGQYDYSSYININDYTCDIDRKRDIKLFEGMDI